MDIEKMIAHQQPFLKIRKIEWNDGSSSIPILTRFWHVDFLDEMWRGTMVSFAPSTLGFDSVSAWHMFSFLNDLGPIYIIWILESARVGNAYTLAYFPTLFAFAGQLLGLGSVAPVFYFLSIVFGPSASDLTAKSTRSDIKGTSISSKSYPLLLPSILFLHTFQVFAAYKSPSLATRHFWTWAWQMTPLYIGVLNTTFSLVLSLHPSISKALKPVASLSLVLGVPTLISFAVWIYTLTNSPYPLSTLFIPSAEPQDDLVSHMRRALQIDEVCVFSSSFLWISYQHLDLYLSGWVTASDVLSSLGPVPIITAFAGPGTALTYAWLMREAKLQLKLTN